MRVNKARLKQLTPPDSAAISDRVTAETGHAISGGAFPPPHCQGSRGGFERKEMLFYLDLEKGGAKSSQGWRPPQGRDGWVAFLGTGGVPEHPGRRRWETRSDGTCQDTWFEGTFIPHQGARAFYRERP